MLATCALTVALAARPNVVLFDDISTRRQTVASVLEPFLAQSKIPGIVVLTEVDGQVAAQSFGLANTETKEPAKADMVFDCGSMGKMFMAVVALRLVEDGKLSLDDRIDKHLNDLPESWRNVTVRHLLSHTSGLPEYVLYDGIQLMQDWEPPTWQKIMSDKPREFEPGEDFQYSNTNFYMAMLIAEKVSGRPYLDLAKGYVFRPAGMTETGPLTNRDPDPRRAQGYWIEGEVQAIDLIGKSSDYGSGSHFTTVSDMHKFSRALFGGKLLKPSSLKEMTTQTPIFGGRTAPYGLGLFVRKVNGMDVWSHGGNSVGYAGSLTYVPATETTVVLLANAYQMSGDGVALSIVRKLDPRFEPKRYAPTTDSNPERTQKLLEALQALATGTTRHDAISRLMSERLERPRGQISMGGYASLKDAKLDAYLGEEKSGPDTAVRLRLQVGENFYTALYTLDKEGKVYQLSVAAAPSGR